MTNVGLQVLVVLLKQHWVVAEGNYLADNLWAQCGIIGILVKLYQSLVKLRSNSETKDPDTIIYHLVRRLIVLSELITSEFFQVFVDVEFHESQTVTWASCDEFFKDEWLKEKDHVSFLECLDAVSNYALVFLIEPHSSIWILSLFVPPFLFDLG